jgi:hypothetical protein
LLVHRRYPFTRGEGAEIRMRLRRVACDPHFENAGQHTSKSLPKVSWRQLANTDAAGKMMLAVFLGTFILLAFLFCVAHLVRA